MNQDNVKEIIIALLKELKIPVTRQTIEEEIGRHPEYNSLLAISDLLTSWNTPNAAYHLAFDELRAAHIPTPFIAYTIREEFVLITGFNEQNVKLSSNGKIFETLSIENFQLIYGGTILIAEKEINSGEKENIQRKKLELVNSLRMPLALCATLLVIIALLDWHTNIFSTFALPILSLAIFKTSGLCICIILLTQNLNISNPLTEIFCSNNDKNNCNAILTSEAAKISEYLSWSEIGFFYFAGSWLALLFNSDNNDLVSILALINIISLPYTFYSIFHQWRVAKQWCRLCCTIQALLWLEFFSFMPYLRIGNYRNVFSVFQPLSISFSLPILLWVFVKPLLKMSQQLRPVKNQLRSFKYNTAVFNKLLSDEGRYGLLDKNNSIIIGEPLAKTTITIVSNPFCQPCAKAHREFDQWLPDRSDIKLQIIFSVGEDKEDPKLHFAKHLLSLQKSDDDTPILKKAVDDWYNGSQKDLQAWARKHPAGEIVQSDKALDAQREWCATAEITATPAIFINGYRLPRNYQPFDLKYLV